MKIFSIIVSHNGIQWYDSCFNSLRQSDVPVQIIVIDNASSDGTVEYIKTNYPEIILIESKDNLGFAKANNIGLRYALDHGGDYVFLLNQDAWLNQTDTISKLIQIYNQNPDYAILSPLQLYGSGKKIEHETLMYFARAAKTEDDFISDLYFNRLKNLYAVPFACAVCWLLPVKTLKEIGGFDPIFYHYGEDDNYIQRVKYFGYKVGICPKVSVSHDIEQREKIYRDDNLDWKKYLLMNLCDINNKLNIEKLLRRKFRVIIIQCLRLNKKLLQKSIPEYRYLKEMKEAITISRNQNKTKQANWL